MQHLQEQERENRPTETAATPTLATGPVAMPAPVTSTAAELAKQPASISHPYKEVARRKTSSLSDGHR